MPIYARRCTTCGLRFETYARMGAAIACEKCGKPTECDVARQGFPAVPKHKLVGKRSRLYDRSCAEHEVPKVRELMAGTGIEVKSDGTFWAPDKAAAEKFYHREKAITREYSERKQVEESRKAARAEGPKSPSPDEPAAPAADPNAPPPPARPRARRHRSVTRAA